MKINFLLQSLYILLAGAELTLCTIREAQRQPIETIHGSYTIRTDGPISLVNGYFFHALGLVQNKRFFSPEMDIKYELWSTEDEGMHAFTRNSDEDSVHEPTDLNSKKQKYTYNFNCALKDMFFIAGDELKIRNATADSFYSLINSNHARAPRILAVLMLLSEGVDLPLEFKRITDSSTRPNEVLAFESKTQHGFRVPLYSSEENSAKSVINFFISACRDFKKDPRPKESFSGGSFMARPSFLLHSFIFQYFTKKDEIVRFFNALCGILTETIQKAEQDLRDGYSEEQDINLKHCRSLLKSSLSKYTRSNDLLDEALDIAQKFSMGDAPVPFSSANPPPLVTYVRMYDRTADAFLIDDFPDCSDISLYSLVCYLVYNPSTATYVLDKLPSPTKELKNFFKIYPRPTSISTKLREEWSRVVQDLRDNKIRYRNTVKLKGPLGRYTVKNELSTGMLNVLRVFAIITGLSDSVKKAIEGFGHKLKKKEMHAGLKREFNVFVRDMLQSLSWTRMDVSCSDLEVSAPYAYKETLDVFGAISLSYRGENFEHASVFRLVPGHGELKLKEHNLYPSRHTRRLLNKLQGLKPLSAFLCSKFISNFFGQAPNKKFPTELAEEVVQTKNFDAFFLSGPITDYEHKLRIFDAFLPYLVDSRPGPDDPVVRLTSNLFASVPLGDQAIFQRFEPLWEAIGRIPEIYPALKIDVCPATPRDGNSLPLDSGLPNLLLCSMKGMLSGNGNRNSAPTVAEWNAYALFETVEIFMENGSRKAIEWIKGYAERSFKDCFRPYFWVVLFFAACKHNGQENEMKFALERIDHTFFPLYSNYLFYLIFASSNIAEILKRLEAYKRDICRRHGDANRLICIYAFLSYSSEGFLRGLPMNFPGS